MNAIAVPVIKELPQLSLENSLILYCVIFKRCIELKISTVASAALCGWSPTKLSTKWINLLLYMSKAGGTITCTEGQKM